MHSCTQASMSLKRGASSDLLYAFVRMSIYGVDKRNNKHVDALVYTPSMHACYTVEAGSCIHAALHQSR